MSSPHVVVMLHGAAAKLCLCGPMYSEVSSLQVNYSTETVQLKITYGNGDPLDLATCCAIEEAKWEAACVLR